MYSIRWRKIIWHSLLMLGLALGVAWQPQTSAAQSVPQPTQRSDQHTVRLQTEGFSIAQVTVDGTVIFRGILLPGETRTWRGSQLTVTIEYRLPVEILFDDTLQGTLDRSTERVTLQWPPTAGSNLSDPTSLDTVITARSAIATPVPSMASDTVSTTVSAPLSSTVSSTISTTAESLVRPPQLYTVQPDDTLFLVAQRFGTDVETLLAANQIANVDLIYVGTTLRIPGSDGTLLALPVAGSLVAMADGASNSPPVIRGSVTERLTSAAKSAQENSPFYRATWLTYYGRPAVPVMGILGEHDIEELTALLKREAAAYDAANGDELGVLPAYHLVYGMATKAPNNDGSHLVFLEDSTVEAYIVRAEEEGFAVILDIQIGALTPAESLAYGLPWLDYANVHLALDPEFAMAHAGQVWPGDPIGYVTAAQINEAQALMQEYLAENAIAGQRVLLVHQFLDSMIENKADLDWEFPDIVLTLSADGWGGPWGKISKYNSFMDAQTRFTAFKLFYRWDEPLMTPSEALGVDGYGEQGFIEVTPNLVIYQ